MSRSDLPLILVLAADVVLCLGMVIYRKPLAGWSVARSRFWRNRPHAQRINEAAYHTETHRRISLAAVDASVLNGAFVKTIGLKALDEDQRFPNSKRVSRTIRELLQDGSIFEDELPRVVNHFYDPVHNIPLTIPFTDSSLAFFRQRTSSPSLRRHSPYKGPKLTESCLSDADSPPGSPYLPRGPAHLSGAKYGA